MRNFVEWLRAIDMPRRVQYRAHQTERVPPVLCEGELLVVYQPIVDLRAQKPFAHEVLARSSSPLYQGPPAMFNDAIAAQFGGALGRALRDLAVTHAPPTPLFVNVHPSEFDEAWLVQPDDPIFEYEHGIYLEITESVPLSHFQMCRSVLAEVRSRGVMLAVDDLGAGYSNLKYIADLAPEVVKLDRELIANIAHGSRQHKLVRALVRLCDDLGAKVVAEGIEYPEEARAARDAGVHYGQGYLFARPAFPPCEPNFGSLL